MKVRINLFATLARYLPAQVKKDDCTLAVTEGPTVDALLRQLKIPGDQVKLIFVDGVHADRKSILKEGNRLGVFPPVGGG